jgi:hypothetical protein
VEKEAPYRLVRDALGFYQQVPIEIPEADVVHEAIVPVMKVKSEAVAPRKLGRPRKRLNAEFEVDLP